MTETETLKIVLNENLPKSTMIDTNKILSFGNHKLILGYLNAYFNHCPIKINPNIIWQLILNKFSKYVEDYSHSHCKSLREKLVDFSGKKHLICVRIDSYNNVNKYQKDIINDFCEQISENVGKEIIDILTPNFTTSNENSIIAGKVSIMSTFKNFFDYEEFWLSCGIPYILLEGSLNDWENILNKLKFLSKYEFYINNIEKDIIEIINTKKGKINLEFWSKIIMETKIKEKVTRPCMFDFHEVEYEYITGWILDFFNYCKIKKSKISDLISEIVEVPIKCSEINENNNNKIKKIIIYAGITDIKQNPDNYEVEPIVNYEFTFDENQEEIEDKEEKEELENSADSDDDSIGFGDLFGTNQKKIENKEKIEKKEELKNSEDLDDYFLGLSELFA